MKLLKQTDIARLTGTKDPAKQIRILIQSGIQPIVRADGRLVVAEEAVLSAMLGKRTQEPVWEAL